MSSCAGEWTVEHHGLLKDDLHDALRYPTDQKFVVNDTNGTQLSGLSWTGSMSVTDGLWYAFLSLHLTLLWGDRCRHTF